MRFFRLLSEFQMFSYIFKKMPYFNFLNLWLLFFFLLLYKIILCFYFHSEYSLCFQENYYFLVLLCYKDLCEMKIPRQEMESFRCIFWQLIHLFVFTYLPIIKALSFLKNSLVQVGLKKVSFVIQIIQIAMKIKLTNLCLFMYVLHFIFLIICIKINYFCLYSKFWVKLKSDKSYLFKSKFLQTCNSFITISYFI